MTDRTLLEDVRDALKPFAEGEKMSTGFGVFVHIEAHVGDAISKAATTLARVEAALAEKKDNTPMTDEQIKHMVDRFLQWKLPTDFNPDGGVTFDPISSKGTPYERVREPVGTNLLSATQAEAMVQHMIEELPRP